MHGVGAWAFLLASFAGNAVRPCVVEEAVCSIHYGKGKHAGIYLIWSSQVRIHVSPVDVVRLGKNLSQVSITDN